MVRDALPALAVGKIYGLTDAQIQNGFENFQNAKMRQNIYEHNGLTIIDDCYNASLESTLAAFETLSGLAAKKNGHAAAVLSDILEAGEYSKQIHEKIGIAAVEKNISVYLFGENSKATYDSIVRHSGGQYDCCYGNDKRAIALQLFSEVQNGDVILFKASRGMAMETVLELFKSCRR
jgi:UDP-N-acetylmuramoyl-tripeptide--D-alanyl-D-alanine ligase